ncbi:hypothetical protein RIF29_00810 [Crotalaria pallida]|uniref:Uncharacterized protein n=1 Tax=Crotalaria pallida TaxID=3830 RepID=A0AAN9IY11_CROPI
MSTNSQVQSILPDKMDVQEDMTLTKRGRDIYEDVPIRTSLEDSMKGYQHKPEHDRSHTMYKNDIVEKEGASETPSGFFPHASTEKRMDNISKGKGKMLQTDVELSILDTNMLISLLLPLVQCAPNGEGFEEGMHLSPNLFSSVEACNKKGTNESKNWLHFSLPEGSSKPQLIRKDNKPNSLRASSHITNSLSRIQKGVYLEDTHDDIPKEMVELMARTQIKRSMADAENKSTSFLDKFMQMEKHLASDNRTHGFIIREFNVYPRSGNATNSFYPYGGYQTQIKQYSMKNSVSLWV